MNRIIFPLEPQMQGPAIVDLQAALELLLDRGVILPDSEGMRRELSTALQRERAERIYGDSTTRAVSIFQHESGLETNGNVDEPTADAINAYLQEWGLLEHSSEEGPFVVRGRVLYGDGRPVGGSLVRAFHESEAGTVRPGKDTSDTLGNYTSCNKSLPLTNSVNLRVAVFDTDGKLLKDAEVIREAKPLEMIDLTGFGYAGCSTPELSGRTYALFGYGLPTQGVKLTQRVLGFFTLM